MGPRVNGKRFLKRRCRGGPLTQGSAAYVPRRRLSLECPTLAQPLEAEVLETAGAAQPRGRDCRQRPY